MTIWVAYNPLGDLIAEADTESGLWDALADQGLEEVVLYDDRYLVGRVTG